MRDFTDITLLLDRSGSMSAVRQDVIGGIKLFIEEQQKAGDNANLTLVQFDTGSTMYLHTAKPIKDVPTTIEFLPRGGTPLLDALGDTIQATGKRLESIPEDERPDKVVFVVYTDGQENSSATYTKAQVSDMIKHQEEKYNWKFIFMSSDLSAASDALSYGFNAQTLTTLNAHNHTFAAGLTSSNIASYRSSGDAQMLSYSAAQRSVLNDPQATT